MFDLAVVERIVKDAPDGGCGEKPGTSLENAATVRDLLHVPGTQSLAVHPGSQLAECGGAGRIATEQLSDGFGLLLYRM